MVEIVLAEAAPSCEANIAYVPRRSVFRFSSAAYVMPTRGVNAFITIAFLTGVVETAGRMSGNVLFAGTEAAPSDPSWRSHRAPRLIVARFSEIVSPPYAVQYTPSVFSA